MDDLHYRTLRPGDEILAAPLFGLLNDLALRREFEVLARDAARSKSPLSPDEHKTLLHLAARAGFWSQVATEVLDQFTEQLSQAVNNMLDTHHAAPN